MLCGHMIQLSGRSVPCGQCMACRVNKKRFWTGRILLEQRYAVCDSSFITLTYDDDHLPPGGSLQLADFHAFTNRLRHRSGIGHFRYFGVGEYGEKTKRPHYHLALFSIDPAGFAERITACWTGGTTHIGLVENRSAAYIAGYATKKITSIDREEDGLLPSFARMSRRPPLGSQGINHIEDLLTTRSGCAALAKHRCALTTFRLDGKVYPIGTYWGEYLRKRLNLEKHPLQSDWCLDYETQIKEREQATRLHAKLWRSRNKTTRTL